MYWDADNPTWAPRFTFILQTIDGAVINRPTDGSTTISIIGSEKNLDCLKELWPYNPSGYSILLLAENAPFSQVDSNDSTTYFPVSLEVDEITISRRQMEDQRENARRLNTEVF